MSAGPYKARGPFTCLHCGFGYLTRRPPGEGEKYCSRECAFKGRKNEQRGAPRLSPVYFPRCVQCQRLFTARTKAASVCGSTCRQAANRSSARASYQRRDVRDREPRKCWHCGGTFSPVYGDKHRVFCANECQQRWTQAQSLARLNTPEARAWHRRLRKRRLGGKEIEPVVIFARDGWRCGICGDPVNRHATVPEHDAPTIDHVMPLALGGAHVEGNVQCAHFICNVRKAATLPIARGGSDLYGCSA